MLSAVSYFAEKFWLRDSESVPVENNVGVVVVINGSSCVGKSSIVHEFQTREDKVWVNVGFDKLFCNVVPKKYYTEVYKDIEEYRKVFRIIHSKDEEGNDVFEFRVGETGQRILKGIHRSIAEFAKSGINCVVDYISYCPRLISDLKKSLDGIKVVFVKVDCSLETIEKREKLRNSHDAGVRSPVGHARSHYHKVHEGFNYDIEIWNEDIEAKDAAEIISRRLEEMKIFDR